MSWETAADRPVGCVGDGDRRGVGPDPVGHLAHLPVLVDGLDAVHVSLIRLDRVVGVGGVRRAGVACDGDEGPHRVDRPVAPQDDVAGDGVVLRVVPGEAHGVVGDAGRTGPWAWLAARRPPLLPWPCWSATPLVSVIAEAHLHLDRPPSSVPAGCRSSPLPLISSTRPPKDSHWYW